MNHYPHHLGDYAKDTLGLSMLEHGAYRLLLDAYYASEAPIPAEDAYAIARAGTAVERKAVDKVLRKFELRDGRYYHKRVEEELAAYRERAECARENGKMGGRPRKPTNNRNETQKEPRNNPGGFQNITQTEPTEKLASSHKPVASNQESKAAQRIASDGDSAGACGAAALENLKALSLQEAKIPGGDETPAAILASVLKANGLRGNAFHPSVVEWSRTGITVDRLKAAIAKARQRPGKEKGVFGPEYLNPILYDETKPAAEVQAEKAFESSRKSVEKAQRIIAEQRSRDVAPMPEHLRPNPIAH